MINSMPQPSNTYPDFGIEIKFDKNKESPAKAFRTLSEILESLHSVDIDLIGSIDSKIKPVTLLEDLETGSIRGWFKNVLEKIPDEGLKDLNWQKAVGHYLVTAKYLLIDFMAGKTTISSRKEIKQLEGKLFELAKQTNVKQIPAYSPISTAKLVGSISKINASLQYAKKENQITYIAGSKERTDFNLEFNFSPESIEGLLTKETIRSESEMILKVKKPDYLGDSQWELRHEKTPMLVKIADIEWLKKFQDREINVRPGDSLRSKVKTTVNYDHNNEVIGTHYEIIQVIKIIQVDSNNQLEFFSPGNSDKPKQ